MSCDHKTNKLLLQNINKQHYRHEAAAAETKATVRTTTTIIKDSCYNKCHTLCSMYLYVCLWVYDTENDADVT